MKRWWLFAQALRFAWECTSGLTALVPRIMVNTPKFPPKVFPKCRAEWPLPPIHLSRSTRMPQLLPLEPLPLMNVLLNSLVTDQELAELGKGLTPANTTRCTKWTLKTFELWKNARNQRFPEDGVPEDLLTCTDPSLLNIHLTWFAVEARKASGEYYPPLIFASASLRHFMPYKGN